MRKAQFTVICLSAICLIPTSVRAQGLLDMGGAFAGFQDSISFTSSAFSADLHYAVFPKGVYPGAQDPSGGTQNVYAYQLLVSTGEVSAWSVGLQAGSGASSAISDAINGVAGGIAPNGAPAMQITDGGSFMAAFADLRLTAATNSTVMLFVSPNDPIFKPSSVIGGGMSDLDLAPSPLPEPGSMALFAAAGLALIRRRRSSR